MHWLESVFLLFFFCIACDFWLGSWMQFNTNKPLCLLVMLVTNGKQDAGLTGETGPAQLTKSPALMMKDCKWIEQVDGVSSNLLSHWIMLSTISIFRIWTHIHHPFSKRLRNSGSCSGCDTDLITALSSLPKLNLSNLKILIEPLLCVRHCKMPRLLAGDWNISPTNPTAERGRAS